MAISLVLHQVTTVLDGPVYRVLNEITAATNMSTCVFVFNTTTQVFDHYANVGDMNQWHDTRSAALIDGDKYYRAASVTRDWTTVEDMYNDLNITSDRLQLLTNELKTSAGLLTIDTTITLTGV